VVDQLPSAPVTSVYLWFEVGAVDEPPELSGAAHFLEHLLFKGTERRGVGQAAASIEGLGGDLNAWTSWDETCLHAVVEASAWREALDVLVDMARDALLDPAELERERLVVLDEIAGYDDDPDSVAADALVQALFGDHPYGRPILGTAATVGAMERDAIASFWRRHYHPARAIIVVCGPQSLTEVAPIVEGYLRSWPAGQARAPIGPPGLHRDGQLHHVARSFAASTMHLGVAVPGVGHPDTAALEVLAAALGQGAAATLPDALELRTGVATDTWASLSLQREVGLLDMGLHTGDLNAALDELATVLRRVHRSGLDGERIDRARAGLLADRLFASESVESRAGDLAWVQASYGDVSAHEARRRDLAAVTSRDVARVAHRYLDPERLTAIVVDDRADPTPLRQRWKQLVGATRAPAPRAPSGSATTRHSEGGITIAVESDDSPLAAVRILATGGQLAEPTRQAGLARAWGRCITRGAGPRDAGATAARADQLTAWFDGVATRSFLGLAATVPADRIGGLLELVGDALLDPHFDPADVANVCSDLLDDIDTAVDRPAQQASESLWQALFPGHPWRRPAGGSRATVHGITPAALHRLHRRTLGTGHLTVAVAGGVAPDLVLATVEAWRDDLPQATFVVPDPPRTPPRTARRRRGGTHQAAAIVGLRSPGITHPDRVPLSLAARILDSQSGRLFLRLREELGWAYSVWAGAEAGVGAGRFSVGVTTSPDRVEAAAGELHQQVMRLADSGPTPDELARVQRMVRGQLALRRQRVAGRCADLAHAVHLDCPYALARWASAIEAVTPNDIAAALRRLDPSTAAVAIAAPA